MTALDKLIQAVGLDPIPGASLVSGQRGEAGSDGIRWMVYADETREVWRIGFWRVGETPRWLPDRAPVIYVSEYGRCRGVVVAELPSLYGDNDGDRPTPTEEVATFLLRQLAPLLPTPEPPAGSLVIRERDARGRCLIADRQEDGHSGRIGWTAPGKDREVLQAISAGARSLDDLGVAVEEWEWRQGWFADCGDMPWELRRLRR